MEDTYLKFGGWGLCRTGERESEVKATENKKWMVTKIKTNPAKRGVRTNQKKKNFFWSGWSVGGSTERPFPDGSESHPLNHRYLRKDVI